jgi:hypothetical protein
VRAWILFLLPLAACASAARVAPEIELPQVPPLEAPDPSLAPAPGRIERDAALADRFTAERQSVAYEFDARGGELSLFSLMTWGYALGWSSRSRLRVLDEQGTALVDRELAGGVAWFDFLAFVAPHDGTYRYTLELEQGWFRYRLVRRSSYEARLPGVPEELGAAARIDGYLDSGADERVYRVHLRRQQRVHLKLLSAEEDARKEQRGQRPFSVHPAFRMRVEGQAGDASFAVLEPGAERDCLVHVRMQQPGNGGRFLLTCERDPQMLAVRGCVVDRVDRLMPGVELEFLRGPDRDPVGRASTDESGNYAIEVPPGAYRVRMRWLGVQSPHGAWCTVLHPRRLDVMWLDDALTPGDELAQ